MKNIPYLTTNNLDIDRAYRLALATLCANIYPFKDGVLQSEKPVVIAGFGYTTPWTRDAAINTWNAGGLVCPEITKDTLLSVLERDEKGHRIGGEYWDKIIWTTGAWWQYIYTGDVEFLKLAHEAVINTLEEMENTEYSEPIGLFRGPACYGDGVAAYPDIYAKHGFSGIIEFSRHNKDLCEKKGVGIPMYSLSTNCLYYHAYVLADKMSKELGLESQYIQKADKMYSAINRVFWNEEKGTYNYLFDKFGGCDYQEGLGISFAMLFGVADQEKINKIFKNHKTTLFGIPCVYPSFPRYETSDGMGFGRHSGTVWPHVQGFWADAAASCGKRELFEKEFILQTQNALRYLQFSEIYHPLTGERYGGRQEHGNGIDDKWISQPYQTWSATAYLRNVYMDLVGMRFGENGIAFEPMLCSDVNKITLTNVKYRKATLNIFISGKGESIKSFQLDNKPTDPFIPADISGEHDIHIELA